VWQWRYKPKYRWKDIYDKIRTQVAVNVSYLVLWIYINFNSAVGCNSYRLRT